MCHFSISSLLGGWKCLNDTLFSDGVQFGQLLWPPLGASWEAGNAKMTHYYCTGCNLASFFGRLWGPPEAAKEAGQIAPRTVIVCHFSISSLPGGPQRRPKKLAKLHPVQK